MPVAVPDVLEVLYVLELSAPPDDRFRAASREDQSDLVGMDCQVRCTGTSTGWRMWSMTCVSFGMTTRPARAITSTSVGWKVLTASQRQNS